MLAALARFFDSGKCKPFAGSFRLPRDVRRRAFGAGSCLDLRIGQSLSDSVRWRNRRWRTRNLWLPYACILLRTSGERAVRTEIDQHRNQAHASAAAGSPTGNSHRHIHPFTGSGRSCLRLLLRLHEKHSFPALRAFGQVRQHPLVFMRAWLRPPRTH